MCIIFAFIAVFVIVDIAVNTKQPYNLVSFAGSLAYILLLFIFSYNPAKVRWRPVVWGLALQYILAMIILRWDFGYKAFLWLGDRVAEFLDHTDAGSKFIFGETQYLDHYFAFKVGPRNCPYKSDSIKVYLMCNHNVLYTCRCCLWWFSSALLFLFSTILEQCKSLSANWLTSCRSPWAPQLANLSMLLEISLLGRLVFHW